MNNLERIYQQFLEISYFKENKGYYADELKVEYYDIPLLSEDMIKNKDLDWIQTIEDFKQFVKSTILKFEELYTYPFKESDPANFNEFYTKYDDLPRTAKIKGTRYVLIETKEEYKAYKKCEFADKYMNCFQEQLDLAIECTKFVEKNKDTSPYKEILNTKGKIPFYGNPATLRAFMSIMISSGFFLVKDNVGDNNIPSRIENEDNRENFKKAFIRKTEFSKILVANFYCKYFDSEKNDLHETEATIDTFKSKLQPNALKALNDGIFDDYIDKFRKAISLLEDYKK